MEDIKVGEYVRDKQGEIHKVYKIDEDTIYCDKPKIENPPFDTYGCRYYSNSADIVKYSINIIDLIEVGDYVNGHLVVNVINGEYAPSGKCVDIDSSKQSEECTIWEDDIKSIVTKEQFKSISYEVQVWKKKI